MGAGGAGPCGSGSGGKMAAPMELFCWAGGWGLPSVDPDCLAVLVSGGGAGGGGGAGACASPLAAEPPLPPPLSSPADLRAVHGGAAEGAPGHQPLEEPLR